ncbi:MAG TPA: ATP-binding protein [Deferrisomatales bacterium]|nr:ATP-binding protein [Deferrisomatales bacterium]
MPRVRRVRRPAPLWLPTMTLITGGTATERKSMADVLAARYGRPLYRVDLAAVVNKYVGETEKNLARVMERAESAGAVLLIDEADALFGKRTNVKHASDRFANAETAYLLQQIESYPGLVILTANLSQPPRTATRRRFRLLRV